MRSAIRGCSRIPPGFAHSANLTTGQTGLCPNAGTGWLVCPRPDLDWWRARPEGPLHRRGSAARENAWMTAAVDWGSVPEWIGSILTSVALIVGALVFRAERAARNSETARRVFVTYRDDQMSMTGENCAVLPSAKARRPSPTSDPVGP
jgi:hypothetical protein